MRPAALLGEGRVFDHFHGIRHNGPKLPIGSPSRASREGILAESNPRDGNFTSTTPEPMQLASYEHLVSRSSCTHDS
ncbi:hypothetical protein SAMN05216483_2333 [Streptomyces sp. 2131.1]|nr:hypothetical protein SAMN05216483_2333 [Streptomyces sp. 2131.1]